MGLRAMIRRFMDKLVFFDKEINDLDAFVVDQEFDFDAGILLLDKLQERDLSAYCELERAYPFCYSILEPPKESHNYYANIVSKRLRARISEMKAMLSLQPQMLRNNANSCLAYLSLLYGLCTGRINSLLRAYFTTSLSRAVA